MLNSKTPEEKELLKYLFVNKGWIAIGIMVTFFSTLLEVPFPFIVRTVIDSIIIAGQKGLLPYIILLLSILFPLKILVPFLQKYYLGKLTRKSGFLIRQSLMDRFVHLHLDMYYRRGTGYFSSRIFEDTDTLIGNLYNTFIPILQNLLILVISVISMVYIKFTLSLIPLLSIPIYIYINMKMGKTLKHKNAILAENRAKLIETFNDIMHALFSIKIRATENLQRLKYLQKDKDYLRKTVSIFKTESQLNVFNLMFTYAAPAVVLIVGIVIILNKGMSLGDYVAFSSFLGFFLGTVKFFFSSNVNFQRLRVAFQRIVEVFQWPTSHEYTKEKRSFPEGPLEISFNSVYFSYGNVEKPVLKDINFSISEGEKVILMGKSGSGKSTILKLILGLYLPDQGSIKISGKSIDGIDILKLRRHTSFLKQEPLLFEGSIEDNICLFKKDRDQELLEKSLRMANIYEMIERLPDGVDTRVERFGNNFSVGERQRIVLSSAFYRNSDLIIFDEPTSSIDPDGIGKIIASIKNIPRDRTVIISTHNQDLIQCGDRLITIDNGEIVDNIVLKNATIKKGIYKGDEAILIE